MPKTKYSNELKLEVVKYCIEKKHSYLETSKHFNITSTTCIMKWVRKYKKHGEKGLLNSEYESHSGYFKQHVIEYMHDNHLSLQETAFHFNIGNHHSIRKWERIYYEEGPQALYEERRGRRKNMNSKQNKKNLSKEVEEDLIEEIQRLRMEHAYLKKLQALVQERTNPKQEKK